MTSTSAPELIPLFDLRVSQEDIDAVNDALRSGWLTMGPRVEALEQSFRGHLGSRHAVAVASGTAALHLAYLCADIGPGDEVIAPAFTFSATVNAVLYAGGTPVFADIVGLHNPTIDPRHVEALLTPRTKAVVAVHYAGYAAAVDELVELCGAAGVTLIEDAAHAPSADLAGRKLGTFGLAGAFSFFSNKVLPVGEGGLLATSDDRVASRARSLRSHAMTSVTWDRHRGHADSYDVVDIGFNYRLDEVRAALAQARLARIESEIERRRALTLEYRRRLGGVSGVLLPYSDEDVSHSSCYVMPIMLTESGRQAEIRRRLREEFRVQTSVLYPAVHEFTAYRQRFPGVSLPQTERAARSQVTIPLFPHMTTEQQDRVVEAIQNVVAAKG